MTNLQKLQNKLTESGLDAMLLTDPKTSPDFTALPVRWW